jgi:hypothetical protein
MRNKIVISMEKVINEQLKLFSGIFYSLIVKVCAAKPLPIK